MNTHGSSAEGQAGSRGCLDTAHLWGSEKDRPDPHRVPATATLCTNTRPIQGSRYSVVAEPTTPHLPDTSKYALLSIVGDQVIAVAPKSVGHGTVHLPSGTKLAKSVGCSLRDQRSLKLRKNGAHLRHRSPLGSAEVDPVRNRHQAKAALCELAKVGQGLGCIPTQAIQSGNDYSVNLGVPRSEQGRDASTTRPVDERARSADPRVGDDFGKLGACSLTPSRDTTSLSGEANTVDNLLGRRDTVGSRWPSRAPR